VVPSVSLVPFGVRHWKSFLENPFGCKTALLQLQRWF